MISSDKVRKLLHDMLWHPATNVEGYRVPLPSGVNYRWRKRSTIDLTTSWIVKKNIVMQNGALSVKHRNSVLVLLAASGGETIK